MRNRHKIGLGRPTTKHKLGLDRVLAAGSLDREELTRSERILRDLFWAPPAAQSAAPVHRLSARCSSAPVAESGAAPRIAKKKD